MLRRGRIPKSFSAGDAGDVYHWKDFGIGIEASVREPTKGSLRFCRHQPNVQMPCFETTEILSAYCLVPTCVHIFTSPLEQYTPWAITTPTLYARLAIAMFRRGGNCFHPRTRLTCTSVLWSSSTRMLTLDNSTRLTVSLLGVLSPPSRRPSPSLSLSRLSYLPL